MSYVRERNKKMSPNETEIDETVLWERTKENGIHKMFQAFKNISSFISEDVTWISKP